MIEDMWHLLLANSKHLKLITGFQMIAEVSILFVTKPLHNNGTHPQSEACYFGF
jgi:hypothetical protein